MALPTFSSCNYAMIDSVSSISITVPASSNADSTQLIIVNCSREGAVTCTGFTEVCYINSGSYTDRCTVLKREGAYSEASHSVSLGATVTYGDVLAFAVQSGKIDAYATVDHGYREDPSGPQAPTVTAARNDTAWVQIVGTQVWGRYFDLPSGVTAISSMNNGNWYRGAAAGYKSVASGATGTGSVWLTRELDEGVLTGDGVFAISLAMSTPASVTTATISGGGEFPYTYATTSISATPATITGDPAGTETITIVDQNGLPVEGATASSSNAAVCSVTSPSNSSGIVTATKLASGTATLTISYDDSMSSAQQDTIAVTLSGLTMTNGLRRRVADAIAAAAVGQKRAAGISAMSSYLGTGWRVIIRRTDGTPADKLIPVGSGSLPTGTSCVITNGNIASTNTIVDTDLGTGTYVVRISNSAMTEYVEGFAGRSAGQFLLANDIDDAQGAAIGTITLTLPAELDGSIAVIPFDDSRTIFSSNPTKTFQQLHTQWPTLTMGMVPHSNSTYATQGFAEDRPLSVLTDPTYNDRNSLGVKFARVADPKNASRTVHLHRLHEDGRFRAQGALGDTSNVAWRASLQPEVFTPGPNYSALNVGDMFVFAIDILLGSDAICTGWGDGILVWSMHHHSGSKTSQTPFFAQIDHFHWDNFATPRFGFCVAYNPDDYGYGPTNGATRPDAGHNYSVPLWQTTDFASMRANWHTFVVRGLHSPNLADNPFVECYLRIGNGGYTRVANLPAQPWGFRYNDYNGSNFLYPQIQLYKYSPNFGGSVLSRSVYTRGMYLWRATNGTPDITVDNALATIDALGA